MAHILVAEDDPAQRALLTGFLSTLGHTVVEAPDGAFAKQAIEADHLDLIVSDLQMPHVDGMVLLAHVQTMASPIPVILISGMWDDGTRKMAAALGCALQRRKPVDLESFGREIESVLRNWKSVRGLPGSPSDTGAP